MTQKNVVCRSLEIRDLERVVDIHLSAFSKSALVLLGEVLPPLSRPRIDENKVDEPVINKRCYKSTGAINAYPCYRC